MPPTSIRLDEDVRTTIEKLAAADDRSISSYINRILRQHIDVLDAGVKTREKSKR